MAEQYEHMTLVIEGGKVIEVDKPRNYSMHIGGGLKAGLFEPRPRNLVNQTVAFALNQLSAQEWEVIHLPPANNTQSVNPPNPFPWSGINPPPAPAPNTGRYEILLRRVIRK